MNSFSSLSKYLVSSVAVLIFSQTEGFGQGAAPNRGNLKVRDLIHGGSGCNPGTTGSQISEDGEAVTVIFDEFAALSSEAATGDLIPTGGPGRRPPNPNSPENSVIKNCLINFGLEGPLGWQYAVFSADIRGYAEIDTKGSATYNVGLIPQARKGDRVWKPRPHWSGPTEKIKGPSQVNFLTTFDLDFRRTLWSKCDNDKGNVTLQMTIKATGQGSEVESYITLDSLDFTTGQTLGVMWRECDPAKRPAKAAICRAKAASSQGREVNLTKAAAGKTDTDAIAKATDKLKLACEKRNLGSCAQLNPTCTVVDNRR